eukprot:GHVU01157861.1.p1 GENE.GHVU01157861.1~~GHVU01157861.1.p1  ORF type:complete len:301 (-),score=14.07 GHVU01157861.1:694-1521(-)
MGPLQTKAWNDISHVILILILYILRTCLDGPRWAAIRNTGGLSVVVICGAQDFKHLPRLLHSIKRQTLPAQEVLFVLSSEKDDDSLRNYTRILNEDDMINVHVETRIGRWVAGKNRDHGLMVASNDIVSFIDCDDVLHPQRNEVVMNMFARHPDLNALLHHFNFHDMRKGHDFNYFNFRPINMYWEPKFRIKAPYDTLHKQEVILNFTKLPWRVDEPKSEPNNVGTRIWKSSVLDIPFSYIRYGEDSIYNWRLLRTRKNVTIMYDHLTAYLRNHN